MCAVGLQFVVLVAGFGVAAVLPEEAYQADSAVCRIGGGEGDARGAPDSAEGIGSASVVERFCICVEAHRVFGNCCPEGVKRSSPQWPRGRQGRISRPKWIGMPSSIPKFLLSCKVSVHFDSKNCWHTGFRTISSAADQL